MSQARERESPYSLTSIINGFFPRKSAISPNPSTPQIQSLFQPLDPIQIPPPRTLRPGFPDPIQIRPAHALCGPHSRHLRHLKPVPFFGVCCRIHRRSRPHRPPRVPAPEHQGYRRRRGVFRGCSRLCGWFVD